MVSTAENLHELVCAVGFRSSGATAMNFVDNWILRPNKVLQDVYLGIGSLVLILSFLAFAGSSFSFDQELKPQLRMLGFALATVGGLLWLRGSYPTANRPVETDTPESS